MFNTLRLANCNLVPSSLFQRYKVNKAKEDEVRAYNARMKPIWDAQAAAEKAKANKKEMETLATQGIKLA